MPKAHIVDQHNHAVRRFVCRGQHGLLRCVGAPGLNGDGASILLVWERANLVSCLISILGHDLFSLESIFDGRNESIILDADPDSAVLF